jgi:hypothetical protein
MFLQRDFWMRLAGTAVIAIVAAVPLMMSGAMDRGFEIAKQCVADPLAVLAAGAVLLAGGWQRLRQCSATLKLAAGAFATFLLLAAVSTALAENAAVAVFGGYYRREGLLAWSVYGAFFLAVLLWARGAGRLNVLFDVLLLASVMPAVYAVQQRLDLDFYNAAARELTRPGSTLGSPLFLAAYLALLLPLAVVRCWLARRSRPELVLWSLVAALQFGGLLLTQTRGPLLALSSGLLMLLCCAAGRLRARRLFAGAAAAFVLAIAALAGINTLPEARRWAEEVPVARRLVFNTASDASGETQRASTSAAARLAIWGAGVDTFVAAPLANKLFGYGPESAFVHYFPQVPPAGMRLIGYDVYDTYDRMHADTLDIGLNFGLLAWLAYALFFCIVMYVAACALWGLAGPMPLMIFAACTLAGGVIAAVLALCCGLATAAVPAFGLGIGAGWLAFMTGAAWRAAAYSGRALPVSRTREWVLLAGLVAALLVFWLDAQINIPVMTTRLISFAFAALVLLLADTLTHADQAGNDDAPAASADLYLWGGACVLLATCASCLPLTVFSAGVAVPEGQWLRRGFTLLPSLFAAAYLFVCASRWLAAGGRLVVAVVIPVAYGLLHYALQVRPGSALEPAQVDVMTNGVIAGIACIAGLCVAGALLTVRPLAVSAATPRMSGLAGGLAAVLMFAVLLLGMLDGRAARADIALRLAAAAPPDQPQLRDGLMAEAVATRPYERHYQRQLIFARLGQAVAAIRTVNAMPQPSADTPALIEAVVRNLNAAESAARAAVAQFPHDPWVVVTLANVLQIAGLRVLRPLDPEGGARAATEADRLFARVHGMFPSQPLFLRNWSQLLADQGRLQEAYRLLDRMEALIPHEVEPYLERIVIARQVADSETISATVVRARSALTRPDFLRFASVANVQLN